MALTFADAASSTRRAADALAERDRMKHDAAVKDVGTDKFAENARKAMSGADWSNRGPGQTVSPWWDMARP